MASIRKRGSSYLLVVSMGYDYEGNRIRPKQKTVHPPEGLTPKQREKWLKEQAVLFERECRSLPQEEVDRSITLAKYTELWLREIAPGKLAKSTLARDRQDIDRFLPILGHYKLAELRPEHFRNFYADLRKVISLETGRPLSEHTVEGVHATLCTILSDAMEGGFLNHNPAWRTYRYAGRKKEKKIAEIYGEKYAEYYHNCIVGGQITYALTVAPLGLFIGAMTNDMTFAILVVAAAAALIVYLDIEVSSAVERKHDEILSDYPEILSKLTLLVNAGMVIREAWTKVAYTCDRAMYKEMQLTSEEMNNGVSELDALHNFAQRCSVKEIRKFTSILSQNIQKGGSELTMSLRYMNEESWEEKKQRANRKGETAGTKLMIPLMIMFVGILFMIIVPIFSNML